MKTTTHFERTIAERGIEREWCERVVASPIFKDTMASGRIRYYGYIEERGKDLRVVLLADGATYHTAFFDSGFRKRKKQR